MKRTFLLILNSIFFVAGMYSIVFDKPLLCALCLLTLSLLFLWKPKVQQAADDVPELSDSAGTATCPAGMTSLSDNVASFSGETNPEQIELSLRIQELTETNRLLNEELEHLRNELKTCTHPIYSCPLTSALPVNLNHFFTDYIRNRFDTDRDSRIHPKFHCSVPEAETYLSAAALKLVCDNVVDNMLKFGSAAKNLYETIYIRIADRDGDSLIIFKNEGEGISEHEADMVFGLNCQGANRKGGTGLGLAQVAALVSDYGGHTWAKSSKNTGFTLYIQLPSEPHL